jgi:hypothetical protein
MSELIEKSENSCPQCSQPVDMDARFCKHCAFDLKNSNTDQNASTEIKGTENKTNPLFVFGGICLLVIGVISLVLFLNMKRENQETSVNVNTNVNIAPAENSPLLTLSEKGLQIEERILRGESLTASDFEGLSAPELRILRNAHFAKYGRKYEKGGLGDYFFTRPWYKPTDDFKDSMISAIDKANVNLIVELENALKGNQTTANISTNTSTNTTTTTTTYSTPTPSNTGELTRDMVLSLLSGYRKDVALLFSRKQMNQANYEQLIREKVISCEKFYPMRGYTDGAYWNDCVPAAKGRGLSVKNSLWLQLDVGIKTPSRVNGISKINETTSYADVVFSFQQGEGYNLYTNYSNILIGAWGRPPNISDEVRRVILRLYDDGWRVENVN